MWSRRLRTWYNGAALAYKLARRRRLSAEEREGASDSEGATAASRNEAGGDDWCCYKSLQQSRGRVAGGTGRQTHVRKVAKRLVDHF
jgi:hypothetical protein